MTTYRCNNCHEHFDIEIPAENQNDNEFDNTVHDTDDCDSPQWHLVDVGHAVMMYMNAYTAHQHYGGPAEGGWYYNSYEPLASVPAKAHYVYDATITGETYTCPRPMLDDPREIDALISRCKEFEDRVTVRVEHVMARPFSDSSIYE